jgi:hypothetical protein
LPLQGDCVVVRANDTPVVKLAYRDVPNQLSNLLVWRI